MSHQIPYPCKYCTDSHVVCQPFDSNLQLIQSRLQPYLHKLYHLKKLPASWRSINFQLTRSSRSSDSTNLSFGASISFKLPFNSCLFCVRELLRCENIATNATLHLGSFARFRASARSFLQNGHTLLLPIMYSNASFATLPNHGNSMFALSAMIPLCHSLRWNYLWRAAPK